MSASYPATRRVAFPPNWPARIALALARDLCDLCGPNSRLHLGALHHRHRPRRALPVADVSAQRRAGQAATALRRHDGEPADRRALDGVRRRAGDPAGPCGGAQPEPCAARLVLPRTDRAVAHVPSHHRRDPVRQGGRLRRAGRRAGADRRVDELPLQAARRSGRGNVDEPGRGGARDRRIVPFG